MRLTAADLDTLEDLCRLQASATGDEQEQSDLIGLGAKLRALCDRRGRPRGFATLTPERRTAIAKQGAAAAHVKGTAHRWTSETARKASLRRGGRRRIP